VVNPALPFYVLSRRAPKVIKHFLKKPEKGNSGSENNRV
jgi:hypothetical protein